jgi:hypothetical protein
MADRRDGPPIGSPLGCATCREEEWAEVGEWGCVGAEVQVEVHGAGGAGCEGAVVVA